MGLPVISEIFDGIRWIIDFFFEKAPKPIQYLVFLMMILLVGNIIVSGLHLFGIHCNQAHQPVKTSVFDVFTNVFIFYETTIKSVFSAPTVSFEDVHTYSGIVGDTCFFALYNNSGNLEVCDNPSTNASCKFYYNFRPTSNQAIKNGCTVCNHSNLGWADDDNSILGATRIGDVCTADAYPRVPHSFDWLFCAALCEIPNHYRFSFDNGAFVCNDLAYCGANATGEVDYSFNERLRNAGATLIYSGADDKSYRKFIGIKCSDDFNPRFAVFGIDIFDFKIWIMLTLLAMLIWGLKLIGQSR